MAKSVRKIPVEYWASTHGYRVSDVILMIKRQDLPGMRLGNQWYVLSAFIDIDIQPNSNQIEVESTPQEEKHIEKTIGRKILDWFLPHYDEVTLFIMSSTVIGLVLIDTDFRSIIFDVIVNRDPLIFISTFVFLAGSILSLVQSFVKHEKTEIEREMMLFFAVIVHAASGIFASIHLLENSTSGFYWVFPIWNFIYSILLFSFFRTGIINVSAIIDTGSSKWHLLVSLLVVIMFILIAHYIIHYHWSIIISISIALAGSLSYIIDELDQHLKSGITTASSGHASI
jgi:hypothetical protein